MKTFTFQSTCFDDPPVEGRIMDVFMPDPGRKLHDVALFIVHGGGWRGGSRADFHWMMRPLTRRGIICCATDYRLRGVNIVRQIEDVRLGWALFQRRLARLGRPSRAAVYGSSAGAHLALLLALARPGACGDGPIQDDDLRGLAAIRPAGAAVQAAPTTMEIWDEIFPAVGAAIEGIVGAKHKDRPDLFRKVSPLRHVGRQSPPVFLMIAQNEHMIPRRHNAAFVEKMRAAGRRVQTKVYPAAEHGFFFELRRRSQKQAYKDFNRFLDSLANP